MCDIDCSGGGCTTACNLGSCEQTCTDDCELSCTAAMACVQTCSGSGCMCSGC
jgi:hypothetical protein